MVDVYIGVMGNPDSVLTFAFNTMDEATRFCDSLAEHYKVERKKLFYAIEDIASVIDYEDMEEVYKDEKRNEKIEINARLFDKIAEMHGC